MYYLCVERNVRLQISDINPRGSKTCVFVHGWPLSMDMYELQTNVLPEMGYRCVLLDLRGFGGSDRPWDGYGYNRMADDLHSVICSLGVPSVQLIGFSMGAAICIRYMARYKGYRVQKLALCGAAAPSFVQRPGYPYGKTLAEVNSIITSLYQDRPETVREFVEQLFASNPPAAFKEWMRSLCLEAAGYSTIKALEALRDEDVQADLKSICVPCGILHGRLDRICSFSMAEVLHREIAQSVLYPFDQSGHALNCDQPEVFNKTLMDFLN
ncbi:alpha/beta hydrolase [Oscillospiraceae bacterium MB08-C2-2]|nr:alpha/beta hydrolase [Oscillospiraceae bacterium MB08-C2-2]